MNEYFVMTFFQVINIKDDIDAILYQSFCPLANLLLMAW